MSDVNVEDGFKAELKSMTKYLHDNIESTTIAKEMANGEISVEDYAKYLNFLLHIHTQLEDKALSMKDEWQKYSINIQKRTRASLLKDDIETLAYKIEPNGTFDCKDWSFANLIGAMYVLEGSTMGGQILSQRLAHLKATKYFVGYKDKTMEMWQEYSMFIDKYAKDNKQEESLILDGAKAVYESIADGMRSIV